MILRRPIRSAGVFSLLVAAAVGLTAEPADARPKKRAPARTVKQVAPPPLPRPSPLRETTIVLVPVPRSNPVTAEAAAPSLRLFAPGARSTAVPAQPPRAPIPAEFAARELAFTAVIADAAIGSLPPELLSPTLFYSAAPLAAAPAPAQREVAAIPAEPPRTQAALPELPTPPALPVELPPPGVGPAAVSAPAVAAPPAVSVPLPPPPPIPRKPAVTAAVVPAAAPVPEPPPVAPKPAAEVAPLPEPPTEEVAAVAPAEPVPVPETPPPDPFAAADAAEDTIGLHEYASLADVPDVVRHLAESLPECLPLDRGARRQPFGDRTLFSFACPARRPGDHERAFVLARDTAGSGANVIMFPRPGGKSVEPMHELSNPRVSPQTREFIHTAVDPSDRPCRQQGRWRIDDRGNAGLLGWRSSASCEGEWTTAVAAKDKDAPAAKASRGSKKSSARKSSRSKAKSARKAPAKKKPVKKKR